MQMRPAIGPISRSLSCDGISKFTKPVSTTIGTCLGAGGAQSPYQPDQAKARVLATVVATLAAMATKKLTVT